MANTKTIQEMLTRAIFEVFEKMYFIFSEPLKGDGGNYQMKSGIDFRGPTCGSIQMLLSRGVAETMAQNMLNLQKEEIDLPIMADCVKESLNMICGNFVRKLDPERVFDLSIPIFEIIPDDDCDRDPDGTDQKVNLTFVTDCGNMRLTMTSPDMM
jgi:CheY-specific phosphatase CheX